MLCDLDRAFSYERWANRRLWTFLEATPDAPDQAHTLFAHVLMGLKVWLMRLRGEDSTAEPLWPTLSTEDVRTLLTDLEYQMSTAAQGRDLDDEIAYTNQHGLAYRTSVRDILTHLGYHGAYHRGQVALTLRQAGMAPPNTDYITFVRELAGQPWKP